jgi:hypothetical protein
VSIQNLHCSDSKATTVVQAREEKGDAGGLTKDKLRREKS